MTRNDSGVHLLVPGLFGPMPRLDAQGLCPDVPNLDRILSRADCGEIAGTDLASTLFGLFGEATAPEQDPPSAPLSRLAATGEADGGFWLHADPTHLRPDQDRLLLFDSRQLGLSEAETSSLVDLFNDHFAEDGLHLEAPHADRWFLRTDKPQRLRTRSLYDAVGRNINALLPQGDDARRWIGLLNEVQMLFHQAAVNRRREAEGRPQINSLWFWGGGAMPDLSGSAAFTQVVADHPLARGLAIRASLPMQPLTSAELLPPMTACAEGTLVVRETLLFPVLDADPFAWEEGAEALDRALTPWLEAIRRRGISTLSLYPCNGTRYVITSGLLRRFWRRSKPIGSRLMRNG